MAKHNWSTKRCQLIAHPKTGFKGSGAMFFRLVQMAEIYVNGAHSANGGANWCTWFKGSNGGANGANWCIWCTLVQICANGGYWCKWCS